MNNDKNKYILPEIFSEPYSIWTFIGGLIEICLSLIYFIYIRSSLFPLLELIVKLGYTSIDGRFLFDLLFIIEFGIGLISIIFYLIIKIKKLQKSYKLLKKMFIGLHIIMLPLGSILDILISLILQ